MWHGLAQFGWQIRDLLKKQVTEVQSQSSDSDVWEVFTKQGRKALLRAQSEARRLQSATVTCEHLLSAILADECCTAVAILARLGVDVDQIRSNVDTKVPRGGTTSDQVRLTDTCRRVANTAHNEMTLLHNAYVGTEHLLLGLTRETGEPAGKILKRAGVTDSRMSREIAALQGGPDRNWPGSADAQDGVWPPPPTINPSKSRS
jgi:ATP-dependent Clp protease ATP-binding subunit ClpA